MDTSGRLVLAEGGLMETDFDFEPNVKGRLLGQSTLFVRGEIAYLSVITISTPLVRLYEASKSTL